MSERKTASSAYNNEAIPTLLIYSHSTTIVMYIKWFSRSSRNIAEKGSAKSSHLGEHPPPLDTWNSSVYRPEIQNFHSSFIVYMTSIILINFLLIPYEYSLCHSKSMDYRGQRPCERLPMLHRFPLLSFTTWLLLAIRPQIYIVVPGSIPGLRP